MTDRYRARLGVAALLVVLAGCLQPTAQVDNPAGSAIDAPHSLAGTPLRLSPLAPPDLPRQGVVVSIPFARHQLLQPGQLQLLTPAGDPLPLVRSTRLHWPAGTDGRRSVRVLEVRIDAPVPALLANTLYLRISDTITPDTGSNLAAALPAAAVLPAQWNIDAHLAGRALPVDVNGHWLDQALAGYTATALNQVPASVSDSEKIDLSQPAPWLFDRAGNLFRVYFRSANLSLFSAAEMASRQYADSITADGFFAAKPGDLKYLYTQPLLYRWMLFGETRRAAQIERMAANALKWPATAQGAGFWTERHANYALLSLVNAWELTGKPVYRQRIETLLDGLLAMSASRTRNGEPFHCPAHTLKAHEGKDSAEAVCSPWMMALLAQTLDHYYMLSGDTRASTLLAHFHQYLLSDGLYRVAADDPNVKLRGMLLPWYLASGDYQFSDNGPFGDLEHSCDVAGLLLRSGARRAETEALPKAHDSALHGLLSACRFNLAMWHRPGADVQYGKPVWRLSPPRKFNWWFGSTQEMTWLLGQHPFAGKQR